jgi:hypothetical protein
MIQFIASAAAEGADGADTFSENRKQALDELNKAFVSFFGFVPEEHKARVLGILLPTFMLLLGSSNESSPYHSLGVKGFLQFASTAPQAFKEATGKLDQQQKSILEGAVREALAGGTSTNTSKTAKPTIALRSF